MTFYIRAVFVLLLLLQVQLCFCKLAGITGIAAWSWREVLVVPLGMCALLACILAWWGVLFIVREGRRVARLQGKMD